MPKKIILGLSATSLILILPLIGEAAPVRVGKINCDLTLYSVTYVQTSMGKAEKTAVIDRKSVTKDLLGTEDNDGATVSMTGQLGNFHVQAIADATSGIVEEVILGDSTHHAEWLNSGGDAIVASLTDSSNLRKISATCKVESK